MTNILRILRTLRKEGYTKSEIDLFNTIFLPNIAYALSVYAPSDLKHLRSVSWAAVLKGNTRLSLYVYMLS